jgi:hypothetical protein
MARILRGDIGKRIGRISPEELERIVEGLGEIIAA